MTKNIALLVICLALQSGCAINDVGLITVRQFENETVYLVRKEAWGAYLSTNEIDGGLMVGHADRLFIYPKNQGLRQIDLDKILGHWQKDPFHEIKDDVVDAVTAQTPIAWISNNRGFVVNANYFHIGFTLGLDSREVVRLPDDFEGVFAFKYSSEEGVRAALGR